MAEKKLTVKQAKFVKEYVKEGNGAKAVKEAYGVTDNNTAAVMANENLSKPNIQQALLRAAERMGITEEKIMQPAK